jgi:uncharacterized protein (DUF362 family)
MQRRSFMTGTAAAVTAGLGANLAGNQIEWAWRSAVFIGAAANYQAALQKLIEAGLLELGCDRSWAKGKSVLLKPNLVEPSREAQEINTHPLVILAAAEVFRSWGARAVVIAEGPGHCRDAQWVLDQSGLGAILKESRLQFIDLNHDDVRFVTNRLGRSSLSRLALPQSLLEADLIVSMPKLKTHHWAGVTLSLKNLFGVMPGAVYGWPKNVLHYAGIGRCILDIAAAVRPHLAIVDGIIGMEGDGPIMGKPRHSGFLAMGTNLPAVDATCARLMKINPSRVGYLADASGLLGPISEHHIEQRGETIASLAQPFQLLDHPSFAGLRT